jgi:hypothetical protein
MVILNRLFLRREGSAAILNAKPQKAPVSPNQLLCYHSAPISTSECACEV